MDFRTMTLNQKLDILSIIKEDREFSKLSWEDIANKHNISSYRARQLYKEGVRAYHRSTNLLWGHIVKHCGNLHPVVATRVWEGLMQARISSLEELKAYDASKMKFIRGVGERCLTIMIEMKQDLI